MAEPDDERMAWIDGNLVPLRQAAVPLVDHGLLAGDGAFETIGVRARTPIALTRHLGRLHQSLAGLGLAPPVNDETLRRGIARLIAANPDPLDWVRLTVTSGDGPFGLGRGESGPRVFMLAGAARHPETVAVITVPWPRNERGATAGLKTISYAENALAIARARAAGAGEALFANTRGELCEGTTSNVFLGLRGRLVTPPLASGCLQGVVRELLIESCSVDLRPVPMAELAEAAEAFVTSSTRGVLPVSSIDGRSLASGPLTAAAALAYEARITADPDP